MTTKRDKIRRLRESTFTGREEELALFRSLLPLERSQAIDILVIYGIGGMGKSRLLDQFQQMAADEHIPTARLDPQVQATFYRFLTTIHQQLKPHLAFPSFEKGLKRHEEIEMKLVGRGDVPRPVLRMFVKGARTALEFVPGASALNELMSAEEMEAHIGKIYAIVGRKEGDFWMKPEDDLTDFLVADLNAYCGTHRLVLLADTYELMGAFDAWLRERVFANLSEHALLVIAGRNKLGGKGWQEFATLMRQHELPPFDARDSGSYLQRKGITDEHLIAEMSDYAGGHPLTLALLADLADQMQAGDLARAPARRDIIRTLLERITQNIGANLRVALEVLKTTIFRMRCLSPPKSPVQMSHTFRGI
ncbi:MAG: ATP-binding protein [Chloroflexaceae bacterium]|nr:ATP-binding protein [Chloroflexaceae bacterium]